MIGERVEIFVETRNAGGWMDRKWVAGTVTGEWSAQENFRDPNWGYEVKLDEGGTHSIHQAGSNWRPVSK